MSNTLFDQKPLDLGAFWTAVNAAAHDKERSIPLQTMVVIEDVDTETGDALYLPVANIEVRGNLLVICAKPKTP